MQLWDPSQISFKNFPLVTHQRWPILNLVKDVINYLIDSMSDTSQKLLHKIQGFEHNTEPAFSYLPYLVVFSGALGINDIFLVLFSVAIWCQTTNSSFHWGHESALKEALVHKQVAGARWLLPVYLVQLPVTSGMLLSTIAGQVTSVHCVGPLQMDDITGWTMRPYSICLSRRLRSSE